MAMDKRLERVLILDVLALLLFIGIIIGVFYLSGTFFKQNNEEEIYVNENGTEVNYEKVRDEIEKYNEELDEIERLQKLQDSNEFVNIKTSQSNVDKGNIEKNEDESLNNIGKEKNLFEKILSIVKFWEDDEELEENETYIELPYSVERNYEEIQSQIIPFGKYVISGEILFFSQYDRRFVTIDNLYCDDCRNIQLKMSIDKYGENYIILEEVENNVYEILPGTDISHFNYFVLYERIGNNVLGYGVIS